MHSQSAKKLLDEFRAHGTDFFRWELRVADQIRPSGEIHDRTAQRLVHRNIGRAVTRDALLRPQRLMKGFSQSNAYILDGVMTIHFEIASASDLHIKQSMLGKESQHVIEEMNARGNARLSFAIEAELYGDIGLFCFTGNFCSTFLVQEAH